ncbi:MAG TPA: polysaccharide biosynthesis/export family protein [Vicinamibacteria bacterium]|nr:polysaccharide biosynthesis/export family protein [Vicinamibacteria bacterium]
MRRRGTALAACLLALAGAAAVADDAPAKGAPPKAPPAAAPSEAPAPPAPPEYRVGPGDVLEVVVFGNDDLSRSTSVQTGGTISLALLGDVNVAGLTLSEIKTKLVSLLARDFLVNPQVDVKVVEFQSQFVTLIGEVNSPGRRPLRGRTRLIDALVEAGGFTPRASGEIVITRVEGTFAGGVTTLRMRLGSAALTPQDQVNLEIPLLSGDIITASPKHYVTVEGEVMRPNRYALEGDLTVSGAVTSAGGLTRFGRENVKVRRIDAQTGQTTIFEVDLKDVRRGKVVDPPLQPNDVVSVSRRFF